MFNLLVGVRAWVVALLLANLIFAGLFVGYPEATVSDPSPDLQPTLKLVNESAESEAGKILCLRWGPFESAAAAQDVQKSLAGLIAQAEIVQRTIKSDPDYLLHVGPHASIEAARLTQETLRSQDIDNQVITAGPLRNSLSVGVYTSRALADAHLQAVSALGYPVSVEELNRNHQVFHLEAYLNAQAQPKPEPNGLCEAVARPKEFL